MMTPYELLGVAVKATDAEIKQAYLGKVKASPPERDQQLFREIHEAYNSIKDQKSRLSYALFTLPTVDFDQLIDQALYTEKHTQVSPERFKQLLNASMDESTLIKAFVKSEK